MRHSRFVLISVLPVVFACSAACSKTKESTSTVEPASSPLISPQSAPVVTPITPVARPTSKAEVGKPAPDFVLNDLEGKGVRLSSFKGKTVVLEWFNPECPYVNASHDKGSLRDAAKRHASGRVVWLAINSGAPGRQGVGVEANRAGAKKFGLTHPILLDESGTVGHLYGATRTPTVMVVDDKGVLAYRGAVDNSPDGEGESAPDGKLVSYVDQALSDLGAGRPVATSETRPYGCTVKYGH